MLINKELTLYRILSGYLRCPIYYLNRESVYLVKNPTIEQRYIGEEIYDEVYRRCQLNEMWTAEEHTAWLIKKKKWKPEDDTLIESLKKEIKDFKHRLFLEYRKKSQRKPIKEAIRIAKDSIVSLLNRKGGSPQLTCEGQAGIARLRYLVGCSVFDEQHEPVFNHKNFWDVNSNCEILEKIVAYYNENKLGETEYRELARSEVWRPMWTCRKVGNIIPGAAIEWTEEQRSLVYWSVIYDNVYEHSECPGDEIIEDDDALDGFFIEQSKQKEREALEKKKENFSQNEKIRGADQVFQMVESLEELKEVEELNDDQAKEIKRQRKRQIEERSKQGKTLMYHDFKDVRKDLQIIQNQLEASRQG